MFPTAEAAEQLGKNAKLVERLVEWCEAKDHAGVMGESNRLLSALIRHSKSKVSPRRRRPLTSIRLVTVEASTVEPLLMLTRSWILYRYADLQEQQEIKTGAFLSFRYVTLKSKALAVGAGRK